MMRPEQASAILRDLAWAVHSPLLCGTPPPHFASWTQRTETLLQRLASAPEQLPDALWERRRTPIGRYFESLIGFWLEQQPDVKGMHHNLPVFAGKRTIGELDLLFDVGGTYYHWELAVKLYLGTGECTRASDWLGPLARDRLDRKLSKLYDRQLLLPQREEARQALDLLGIPEVHSYGLVKGYLFHPFARWRAQQMGWPASVLEGHARGWWLRQADAALLAEADPLRYQVLPKAEWLGPASGEAAIASAHIVEWLADYFARDQRAILVAALDEAAVERHRGFVVANDWAL